MHDAAKARLLPFITHYLNRVIFSLSSMNDDGQLRFSSQHQLTTESCTLHIARRIVVVIVKSYLAPGDDFAGSLQKFMNPLFGGFVKEPGIVRMNPNCRVKVWVVLGQLDSPFKRTTVWIPSANVQDRANTCISRPLDYLITISVKLRTIDVCVRINKNRRWTTDE